MEKHGLVTRGDTSEACYAQTIRIISEAEAFIEARVNNDKLFGGRKHAPLAAEIRRSIAAEVMPAVRGAVSDAKKMILSFDDQDDVLDFVGGIDSPKLSQAGAACPDHLVHTKVVPLFIDWTPNAEDVEGLKAKLIEGIAAYKAQYQAYFERNRHEGDVMFEAAPRVILIPDRNDQHRQELGDVASQRRPVSSGNRGHARRNGARRLRIPERERILQRGVLAAGAV